MTAHDYMLKAISDIDELLGKGYAKQHPELIAAYLQSAALDFGAAIIARAIETLSSAVENIDSALRDWRWRDRSRRWRNSRRRP